MSDAKVVWLSISLIDKIEQPVMNVYMSDNFPLLLVNKIFQICIEFDPYSLDSNQVGVHKHQSLLSGSDCIVRSNTTIAGEEA